MSSVRPLNHNHQRLYHFLKCQYAMDDLARSRIKLSVFDNVNDVDELRAYRLEGLHTNADNWLVSYLTNRFSFLCLAENWADPHMWNCYGDTGRGMCFGLDIKKDKLRPINYVDNPHIVKFPPDLKNALRKEYGLRIANHESADTLSSADKRGTRYLEPYVLTKFARWSIENETRAFFRKDQEENGFCYSKFNDDELRVQEIILGQYSGASADFVRGLVKSNPCQPIAVRCMADDSNQI